MIDFRALTGIPWNQDAHTKKLKQSLPDYPTLQMQRELQHEFKSIDGRPPVPQTIDLGPSGILMRSEDNRYVAQFQRTGFVFSRLSPYQDWSQFTKEALRLWEIHAGLARPVDVSRIGVRFINKMGFPVEVFKLDRFLQRPPQAPPDLPLPMPDFLHQESYFFPRTAYLVNVIKTMQAVEGVPPVVPVILDIDAFIQQPIGLSSEALLFHLTNLHWLKNKIFFASITQQAIDLFQ